MNTWNEEQKKQITISMENFKMLIRGWTIIKENCYIEFENFKYDDMLKQLVLAAQETNEQR